MQSIHLFPTHEHFPNFALAQTKSVLFVEYQGHLLFIKQEGSTTHSQDGNIPWGLPETTVKPTELPKQAIIRLFKEQTQIDLPFEQLSARGKRYTRFPGLDTLIHFFSIEISEFPSNLSSQNWTSIFALKLLPPILGRDESFALVFKDRLWQRIVFPISSSIQSIDAQSKIVFQKGDKTLTFDHNRKLIVSLIGAAGSGKSTQAVFLEAVLGIPRISERECFQAEFDSKSTSSNPVPTHLGEMVQKFAHDPSILPSEISLGIMAKRLSRPDCNVGFILDSFPATSEQCDAIQHLFIRSLDCVLSLHLQVPEKDLKFRFRTVCPDQKCNQVISDVFNNKTPGFCPNEIHKEKRVKLKSQDPYLEERLLKFKNNAENILKTMNNVGEMQTLKLKNDISDSETFHLINLQIQKYMDQLAAQEERSILPQDDDVAAVVRPLPTQEMTTRSHLPAPSSTASIGVKEKLVWIIPALTVGMMVGCIMQKASQ